MSLRPILKWPDARLSAECTPIDRITQATVTLAEDMLETMYVAQGRGLAAPQVGVLSRLFVMDVSWKEGEKSPKFFVNPEISWMSQSKATVSEGCLSIPGVSVDVERPDRVRLRWTDLEGNVCESEFEGFAAVCVQHELDHLDGKVMLDWIGGVARARVLEEYAGGVI